MPQNYVPIFIFLAFVGILIPVTLLMHQYWKHTDPMMRINDQVNFMKNVAILGASWILLMLPQPWPNSLNL